MCLQKFNSPTAVTGPGCASREKVCLRVISCNWDRLWDNVFFVYFEFPLVFYKWSNKVRYMCKENTF